MRGFWRNMGQPFPFHHYQTSRSQVKEPCGINSHPNASASASFPAWVEKVMNCTVHKLKVAPMLLFSRDGVIPVSHEGSKSSNLLIFLCCFLYIGPWAALEEGVLWPSHGCSDTKASPFRLLVYQAALRKSSSRCAWSGSRAGWLACAGTPSSPTARSSSSSSLTRMKRYHHWAKATTARLPRNARGQKGLGAVCPFGYWCPASFRTGSWGKEKQRKTRQSEPWFSPWWNQRHQTWNLWKCEFHLLLLSRETLMESTHLILLGNVNFCSFCVMGKIYCCVFYFICCVQVDF